MGLVIVGLPKVIVIVSVVTALVPVGLVAVTFTLVIPTVEGVPEIKPVAVTRLKPAGSGLAVKLVGLFVAVI